MEARYPEITAGEALAKRIKEFYFADKPWPEVYMQIARIMSRLKPMAAKYMPDKDQIGQIHWLCRMSKQDMDEALEN